MYAQLGNIAFSELKGFERFTRSRSANYAEIPLVLGKPALQRTGESLTDINVTIKLHADFSDVENDTNQFYEFLSDGEVLPLVLGNGLFLGNFVITDLNEAFRKTAVDGSVIVVNLDLQLKESPTGDELVNQTLQAKNDGFASDIRKTVPEREVIAPPSDATDISGLQTDIQVSGVEIDNSTATAIANPSKASEMFAIISEAGQLSSIAALEMAEKLNQIEFALSNVADLIDAAEDVAMLADNVKTAADSGIIGDVQMANDALKNGNANLYAESGLLVALISARVI